MKSVLKIDTVSQELQIPPENWVLKFVDHSPSYDVISNVDDIHNIDTPYINTLDRNIANAIYEHCAALDADEEQTICAIAILDEVRRLGDITWDRRLQEEDLSVLFGLFLSRLDLSQITRGDSTVYTSMLKQDVLRFLQAELSQPPYLMGGVLAVPLDIDNTPDEYPDNVSTKHISKHNYLGNFLREISKSPLDWVREYHGEWSAAIESLAHSYNSNQLSNNDIYPLLSAMCHELNPTNLSDLRKAYWNHRPYLIQVQDTVHYNSELLRKHLLELILETADLLADQQEDDIDVLLGYRVDTRQHSNLLHQLRSWSGSLVSSAFRALRSKTILPKFPHMSSPLAAITNTIKRLTAASKPKVYVQPSTAEAPITEIKPVPAVIPQLVTTSENTQEVESREMFNKRFLVSASKIPKPTIRYVLYALARQGQATKKDPQDILNSLQSSPHWQAMVTVELAPIVLDSPITITDQGKASILQIEKELQQSNKKSA